MNHRLNCKTNISNHLRRISDAYSQSQLRPGKAAFIKEVRFIPRATVSHGPGMAKVRCIRYLPLYLHGRKRNDFNVECSLGSDSAPRQAVLSMQEEFPGSA